MSLGQTPTIMVQNAGRVLRVALVESLAHRIYVLLIHHVLRRRPMTKPVRLILCYMCLLGWNLLQLHGLLHRGRL